MLLAAFHPGYIMSQVPAAFLVKSRGPKLVNSIQLIGAGVCIALLPAAGRLKNKTAAVAAMSLLMFSTGLFQGPMAPVKSQLGRDWMKNGIERAWAARFNSISHSSCPLLAALITTRISARFSWRAVCYIYAAAIGIFAALWQLLATDKPVFVDGVPGAWADDPPQVLAQVKQKEAERAATAVAATRLGNDISTQRSFDWRVLWAKPSLALGIFHICNDILVFTQTMLAPTMYLEKFGCTPLEMGSYLALGSSVHIPAGFLWATIESVLIRRKVSTLTIRRGFEGVAHFASAVFGALYAFAPNVVLCTICYGAIDACNAMHTSGGWSNYQEVGGEDTAMLNSCWNTLASSTAIAIPFLGFALERRTGSWAPMIMLSVATQVLSGATFLAWSSTEPIRDRLDRQAAVAAACSRCGRRR